MSPLSEKWKVRMKDLKVKVKDSAEDIGFIAKRDPWLILTDHYGKEFAEYRRKWRLASDFKLELEYPLQIDFELNNTCNLKCIGCAWSKKGPHRHQFMPFDTFKRLVAEGVKEGLRAIDFSFVNEPLIRKDLSEFIRFAKDAGVLDLAFNTNANLLTDVMIEDLLDSGLTRIQFSVDAFTGDTYKKVRPGGDFKKVINGIEKFLKRKEERKVAGLLTAVSFLKMSVNAFELKSFIAYWERKVDYLIIREYLSPYGRESEHFEEKSKLFEKERHFAKDFKCNKPWQRLIVRADGTVLPCCAFFAVKLPMGNIHDSSISDIWKSVPMRRLRSIHKSGEFYNNKVCLECARCSTWDN